MINEKSSFDSILFKKNSGNGIEPPIFDDDIIHRYNHFLVFLVFFFGSKFHDFVLIFLSFFLPLPLCSTGCIHSRLVQGFILVTFAFPSQNST